MLAGIPVSNHIVKSIKTVSNSDYVYDLKLGSIHNFGIDAGIFVHNCGAIFSALKESIIDEVDERRTLDDFLRANQYNSYLEADALSAEEMINKEIDDMIEQMEMSGFTYGEMGGIRGF
jgi:hypothetical protein